MHHRGLQILYQDAKQVVVNKPVAVSMQGRPTSPGGHAWRKALADLESELACKEPLRVVHRLDSGTSGALILAKTAAAARSLAHQFQNNEVSKMYLAIVMDLEGRERSSVADRGLLECGLRTTTTGVERCEIGSAADVKDASAVYWRLATRAPFHLLELSPETGRKHQLRIQCAQLLRAPVVGDFKYGYEGARVQGHLLHCATLRFFTWERTGKRKTVEVTAPLPAQFTSFARDIRLHLPPPG